MPAPSQVDLVDRLLDGQLFQKLDAWQQEGLSLRQIAHRLHHEHGITITTSTLSRWLNKRAAEQEGTP